MVNRMFSVIWVIGSYKMTSLVLIHTLWYVITPKRITCWCVAGL